MPPDNTRSMQKAKSILGEEYKDSDDLLALSKKLKGKKSFGLARKMLTLALEDDEIKNDKKLKLEVAQQQALCTYKDPDLPISDRLERALNILNRADDLSQTHNQETLGLAGSVYKRKWEVEGHKQHLERSFLYYNRGYTMGPVNDFGYTGINAAFVLDRLSNLEEKEAEAGGAVSEAARERRKESERIREDLIAVLPGLTEHNDWLEQEYWFLVTIAEAYFGLQRYEEARPWLQKAAELRGTPPWELETTARQLADIVRMRPAKIPAKHDIEADPAWDVLKEFLGNKTAGVRTAFLGKVGVALSGGGFRASLFHIGVLAKLAELDMLRHVEVLSCVSGGSIVGAHYYLELRRILQNKRDHEITREDYIEIIQNLCDNFLKGVKRNIRTRVAAEFLTNLKMIFWPDYSRTQRAGELYEEELYRQVEDKEGNTPRWLNKIFIYPRGEDKSFKPKYDNWRRAAKVPILILNATTLNTGHNWQFTASWMGEPPSGINTAIDGNYRLRRMYYHEAPEQHRNIRLGHAVAASACVPGLFEPIVLPKLYRIENKDITVRLVDGGVHDNQGIMGLLDQDCNAIIVSDASGQMGTQDNPSRGVIGVPLRSNSILMARVREAEYREVEARLRSSLLRNLMFIHLKKDLNVNPVNWIGCDDPKEAPEDAGGDGTNYGILKEVQEKLAAIRTDLDSFSDVEAYALMISGYRMVESEFDRQFSNFPKYTGGREDWPFLQLEDAVSQPAKSQGLMKLLDASRKRAFKIWYLSWPLKICGLAMGIAALAAFFWVCLKWPSFPLLTLGVIGMALAVLIASTVFGKTVVRIVRFRETLSQIGIGIAMSLLGWILARIHLHVFDRLFLRKGRLESQKPFYEIDK